MLVHLPVREPQRPAASVVAAAERGGPGLRTLGWALIALATLVGACALLGPLVFGVVVYHVSAGASHQVAGLDVVALVLVAPVGWLAGIACLRGHPAGPVLGLGPAGFATYVYAQLAIGGEVFRYPGNSERFFPLLGAVFVLAAGSAALAWALLDPSLLPRPSTRSLRRLGTFLLVVAVFLVVGLHLPGLLDSWKSRPGRIDYLADPGLFWLVKLMDLGIVVPILGVVGLGLRRDRAWAVKAAYGVFAALVLLASSVAAMSVVMVRYSDPGSSVAMAAAFVTVASIGLFLGVRFYLPALRRGRG